MNYNFEKNKPFMDVSFHDTESDVINKLGYPEEIIIYENNGEEKSVWYQYDEDRCNVIFQYDHDKLDYLTFHTSCLYINGKDVFSFEKYRVLEIVKSMSLISLENALVESYEEFDILCESYNFDDIGLMLWFEDADLDDVCIFSPG